MERNVGSAIQEFDCYSLILKAHCRLQNDRHYSLFSARIIVSVTTQCFFGLCFNIIFALVPRCLTSSFSFKIFNNNFLYIVLAINQTTLTESTTKLFLLIGHVVSSQTKWSTPRHADNLQSTRPTAIRVTKISTVITTNNYGKPIEIVYHTNRNSVSYK